MFIVEDLVDVIACGFVPLLITILGGACSACMPVSSMLKNLSGCSSNLCFSMMAESSPKYLSSASLDADYALARDSFWGLATVKLGQRFRSP
jgi:hypothetical protein